MTSLPALSIVGTPSKRKAILELAVEAERRGFAELAITGNGSGILAMCASVAHVTTRIPFSSSIQPIYLSHPIEVAGLASHVYEVSGGRFQLGIGVSHLPLLDRLGLNSGQPLADMRAYVEAIRAATSRTETPLPVIVAALRDRMLDLAIEVGDGAVWANASHSFMSVQVSRVPAERRDAFALSNMVPTVIDDDLDAARAIHRRTLGGYITLPNYRNYWRAAGFGEEMDAIEVALAKRDREAATAAMSDRWIDDCTISGGPSAVRDELEAWYAIGVTPIATMSSTSGGQAKAINELFELYA